MAHLHAKIAFSCTGAYVDRSQKEKKIKNPETQSVDPPRLDPPWSDPLKPLVAGGSAPAGSTAARFVAPQPPLTRIEEAERERGRTGSGIYVGGGRAHHGLHSLQPPPSLPPSSSLVAGGSAAPRPLAAEVEEAGREGAEVAGSARSEVEHGAGGSTLAKSVANRSIAPRSLAAGIKAEGAREERRRDLRGQRLSMPQLELATATTIAPVVAVARHWSISPGRIRGQQICRSATPTVGIEEAEGGEAAEST